MKRKTLLFIALTAAAGAAAVYSWNPYCFSRPNHVTVTAEKGSYALWVNGSSLYIQGAGVGQAFGMKGENYLAMAKDLGANAVRTWGVDQGTRAYLDEALRQGLFVNAGIWLDHVDERKTVSYVNPGEALRKKEKEALDYVRRFKNHPAVLFWNIGNEVIQKTKDENERVAFCRFLEALIQKVKKIDPHHPIVYASVPTTEVKYLKKYVPSLDILGANDYGSCIAVQSAWAGQKFQIPYLLTEYGPLGPWDLPKDLNGKAMQPSDYTKASQYRNYWNLIRERRGNNIGGFVFHLGETSQESLYTWNINDHAKKREPFVVIQKMYKTLSEVNHAPKLLRLDGVPDSAEPGQSILAQVSAVDPEGEVLEYDFEMSQSVERVEAYYVNQPVEVRFSKNGEAYELTLPKDPGIYHVYAKVYDRSGNSAVTSRTVRVESDEPIFKRVEAG